MQHIAAGKGQSVLYELAKVALLAAGDARFRHMARLLRKNIDKVGTRDHADNLVVFHNGHKALAASHDDCGQILERCIRRQCGDSAGHVVFNRGCAKAVGAGPRGREGIQQTGALAGFWHEDGHGLEPEVEHEFIRLMNGGGGLNAHCWRRHIFARGFIGVSLGVEVAQNYIAYLVHCHGAHRGRSRVGMPAAAKGRADVANVDGLVAAAGHHLNTVVHKPDGKQHREFFHFHKAVGQIGEITQIMLHGRF